MRKVLFLFLLIAFVLTSSAWAADISGAWTVKMKSPMGEDESFDIAVKAAGENLTVTTSNHPKLKEMAGTGTLKGDAITMNLKATGEQKIEIVFTGKVAGNKISGTREISMAGGAPGGGAKSADSADSGEEEGAKGAPPAGGAAPAAGGAAPPAGGAAPAAGGAAPPAGGAPAQGGAPGGAAGGEKAPVSNAFTAEKK
jgi:hypothetical protein